MHPHKTGVRQGFILTQKRLNFKKRLNRAHIDTTPKQRWHICIQDDRDLDYNIITGLDK